MMSNAQPPGSVAAAALTPGTLPSSSGVSSRAASPASEHPGAGQHGVLAPSAWP